MNETRSGVEAIRRDLEEHRLYVNQRLSNLEENMNRNLDLLDSKQDDLNIKVTSINSQLEHNILTNVTKQLQKTSESLGPCGGEGWRRVAYLDMTDPDTTCPSGWQLGTRGSKKTCDRFSTGSLTCDSVFFPVSGGAYTTVCGRIRAYQYSSTDAFESYHNEQATTIDEPYVSGVSLTHGSPRQHIWTFAAGITEAYRNQEDACPCDDTVAISIPPFVGEDYFCESGDHSGSGTWGGFHPDDPLWDGAGCTSSSTCCSFNNPPYFTKQLPNPTTDDLEVRLCLLDSDEDAPIEFIELYVGLGEMNTKEPDHNVLINTQQLTDMINSKMELINVSMREEFRAVERQFQEHKNQTTSELSDLHTSLQSTHTDHLTQICDKMNSRIISISSAINGTIDSKLDLLDSKQDELKMKMMLISSELEHTILKNVTHQTYELPEYDDLHECGGTGGWRRVAYLDMTDPNTTCPSGWKLNTRDSKRVCDTGYGGYVTCDSVFFPVSGGAYNRVCGTIRGYNRGGSAFTTYARRFATTIDSAYVSGVSLTHGSPRQHIWTFAAGGDFYRCFCDGIHFPTPSFVGRDYFCEATESSQNTLWDGQNCTIISSCCSFNNPPYFTKQLPNPTGDDIEIRQCQWAVNTETPIEFVDIYVKLEKIDIERIEINVLSGVREELKKTQESLQKQIGNMNVYECAGTGGWRRAAYMDMTDPKTNCPSGWLLSGYPKRSCGKVNAYRHSCDSVFFPVSGGAYSYVCGRIRGYQYDVTTAFKIDHEYYSSRVVTIDQAYVSGVSLTHGSPRQHIWTFAAGAAERRIDFMWHCPCDAPSNITIPSFVGEDYFCESGSNSGSANGYHPYDPLWDGKNCTSTSTCCSFNNPPYFTKQLPNPTTDDLEIRQCQTYLGYVGTPIELIELYVK